MTASIAPRFVSRSRIALVVAMLAALLVTVVEVPRAAALASSAPAITA